MIFLKSKKFDDGELRRFAGQIFFLIYLYNCLEARELYLDREVPRKVSRATPAKACSKYT